MKFKIGDIVRIKKRDNPNNWLHSGVKFCNAPRKVVDLATDVAKVFPPLEIYILDSESNKWVFSNYNDLLGIHTLEHAMPLQIDSKLFEI